MKQKKFEKSKSRFIFMCSQMPPLAHWPDRNVPFKREESEVCKWLMGQEWFWDWAMQKARDVGAIVFDEEAKKWVGAQTDIGQTVLSKKEIASGGAGS